MRSSTSTSIHEAHSLPFNTVHRRQPSYSVDLQDSNTAGRPFPFVPKRRSSSGGHTLSEDSSACPSPQQGQIRLVDETTSEDSATPQSTPRIFRTFPRAKPELARGRIPELDTDLRSFPPLSDQPGTPAEGDIAGTPNLSHPISAGPSSAFLLRKKSGELVKPSLKSTGFATWAVSNPGRGRTKSAPTTPMGSKSVHFDAHLEHVKLFLAEQKPLAVSRDGSPTETSEGDTTDTGFPFPRMTGMTLHIKPIAIPYPPLEPWTFDVRLETLALKDTTLVGQVLVRNLAFTKWVAVRFTLDAWQTTSEVAARHVGSLHNNTFDRFEFRVRLVDYISGIEFKRLVLCVRFSVEGREMWDSNGGRNYEVGFDKVRDEPLRLVHTPPPSGGRNGPPLVADLRRQLEKVAQNVQGDGASALATALHNRKPRGLRVWLGDRLLGDDDDEDDDSSTPPLRPRSRSPSPLDDQNKASGAPSLYNKDVLLSARYDFGASLRGPNWAPPQAHTMPPSQSSTTLRSKTTSRRARSPPPPSPTTTTAVQFPRAGKHRRRKTIPLDGSPSGTPPHPRGSPRDSADFADDGVEEHHRSRGDSTGDGDRPRHHSRGWVRGSSLEQIAADSSTLKKTPPGMPAVIPPTPHRRGTDFHINSEESSSSSSSSVSPTTSRAPYDNVWGAVRRNEDQNSTSTPSITTASSTPTTQSPLSPRGELPRATSDDSLATATTPRWDREQRPPINSTPYYSFLDQFCFFTGVTTHYNNSNNTPDSILPRRVQSASTVEDFLAAPST